MTWKFRPILFAKIVRLVVQWILSMFLEKETPAQRAKDHNWDANPMDLKQNWVDPKPSEKKAKEDESAGGLND